MINDEGDGPYISKEQTVGISVLCRSKRADMVFRAVQPWSGGSETVGPRTWPEGRVHGSTTTRQHFRVIAQAMGIGS